MRSFPFALSIALLASTLTLSAQGPLQPPGPPAPTMKTLEQVEARKPISSLPITITTAGSYYVTGNLAGNAAEDGITINADNVTIDLNGFALIGTGSRNGIFVENRKNIAVRNGTIRDWEKGVYALGTPNCEFEKIRVSNNASDGLVVFQAAGANSIVKDCVAEANGGSGIGGFGVTVSGCSASNNDFGFFVRYSTVQGSTAYGNAKNGIDAADSSVSNCTARGNGLAGFLASNSTLSGSTATANTLHGISVGSGSTILNNTSSGNGTGPNPGSGIFVTGSGNRIESNNTTNNDSGVRVTTAGNLIVKNSSRGGTGYLISNGNSLGRVINVADPNGTTISNANNNSDPWANFAY